MIQIKLWEIEVAINPEYDGYERELASMVYKIFDKKTGLGALVTKVGSNKVLAQESRKSVIKKIKEAYTTFKDNIWALDLFDMELLSSDNQDVKYFLSIIDVYNKYAWVKHLTNKAIKDNKAKW